MPPFLPVRMLNEFTYCAGLGYLEWVQGEFADNDDTVEGRSHHRNVDRARQRSRRNEDGDEEIRKIHERSVWLGSERLGLNAKIDSLEGEGQRVTPIDYKRGKRPHVPRGAYEPELVQLCAQGLLLRDHDYECDEGVLYFVGSRERVRVLFDDELVAQTTKLAAEMRAAAAAGQIPPPLVHSPKCPRCSPVGICLPDEVRYLTGTDGTPSPPRPLVPARDDALPLHVQHPGARIRKDGEVLQIVADDEVIGEARLAETSQVVLFGSAHVTTPVVQELCQRAILVCYLSSVGWFYGITHGMSHRNVELRRQQYAAASDSARCPTLARRFAGAISRLWAVLPVRGKRTSRMTHAPQHLYSAETAPWGRAATDEGGRFAVEIQLALVQSRPEIARLARRRRHLPRRADHDLRRRAIR